MYIFNNSSSIGLRPDILTRDSLQEESFTTNKINPKLSIISCSMNLGRFLEDTILSVARQTYKNFEHIIIDAGSTDETIGILRKYPHLTWISEKDSGYVEGLRKGLAMAKGDLIMQCAVSDGYIDKDWFKKCIELMETNREISLVWGFPQYLSEEGILGQVSYQQFHINQAPNGSDFFSYWLKTFFWVPEGNFCVRAKVFKLCFPENIEREVEPYLEFNYRFHKYGYLAHHIPSIANFGRTHSNQLGQLWQNNGIGEIKSKNYFSKCRRYRIKHLFNRSKIFIDKDSNIAFKFKIDRRYLDIVLWETIKEKLLFVKIRKIIKKIPFVFNLVHFLLAKYRFRKSFTEFSRKNRGKTRFLISWNDRWPCLNDNTPDTNFDRHYIYHPSWAARIIKKTNPELHVDISSILYFSSILSAFVPVKFYDYRPAKLVLTGLESVRADLLNLDFDDNTITSLSCMHTVEHVGLGRYGDPIDYDGDLKAMAELARVLAIGGNLLFVVPVGNKSIIQFNAHRIYTKEQIIEQFKKLSLDLKEFALIPENEADGGLVPDPSQELLNKQKYACGCFWFTKHQKT